MHHISPSLSKNSHSSPILFFSLLQLDIYLFIYYFKYVFTIIIIPTKKIIIVVIIIAIPYASFKILFFSK